MWREIVSSLLTVQLVFLSLLNQFISFFMYPASDLSFSILLMLSK